MYMSPSPPHGTRAYANGYGPKTIRKVTNIYRRGGLGEVGATSFDCGFQLERPFLMKYCL